MFAAYANYWNFQARASRSEYWLFTLWMLLLGLVAGLVDVFVFREAPGGFGPLALFVTFANLIPSLSVTFRRLHDTNRTAWWLLVALIPLAGAVTLFVFSVMRGTPGENRFGPAPGNRRRYEELEATFA